MSSRLDFANVNAAALGAFPAVLLRLLPGGRIDGREFVALNPRRNDNRLGSFKIRWRVSFPKTFLLRGQAAKGEAI